MIDGFLHLVGRVFIWIGDFFKVVNLWLIDGVGDGIPQGIGRFGGWFRQVQTGRTQNYMLMAALAALMIGLVLVVSTGVFQASG